VTKYLLDGEESERLLFRKTQQSDFDSWVEFFRDPKSHLHWTPLQDPPEIGCKNWYAKQHWRYENNMGGMNALIYKHTGKLIGHCGLLVQTVDGFTELEIGYSLISNFWNNGFAREAAFENRFAESLISIISKTNIASQKVAIANGMKQEKATLYHENEVFIYRIFYRDWLTLKSMPIENS
jgi:[ribosomal protein S5]-alanine N-acetyltransferase